MENQKIQTSQTNVQRVEIKSLEQMESFLDNLQARASDSLAAALNAQLQVIRYVSSPQLLDSTFDLFFQNLKKAKEYASTPRERDVIVEKGILMIQNYVFFMNAKLTYAIKDNKEEGRKLFEEAGKQLSKSVVEIAGMYVSGGASLSVTVAQNLFQNAEQNLGLFRKLLNWWNKEQINQEKQLEFYKSLESLVGKLNKRKDVIGQSNLIAGLVENYTEDLTDFATAGHYDEYVKSFGEKAKSLKRIWTTSLAVLGFSVAILILRGIWHLLQDAGNGMKSWFSDDVEKISRDGWVATHFMWTGGFVALAALIFFIVFLTRWWNCKKAKKEYVARYNEVREYYSSIAASFEE